MLRLILDSHPALAIPTGTFFIPEVVLCCAKSSTPSRTFLDLLTAHWKWADFHINEDSLRRCVEDLAPFDVGEALRVFYRLYAERFGKPRWGDKSSYLWDMEIVQSALPEVAFVHLIRDGRDVALSIVPLHWGPNSIAEAAKWWVSGIERARVQAPHLHRYLEVRYEALVTDTESVLRRICAFINLPFSPAMLGYYERAEERLAEMMPVRDPNSRRVMTAAERAAVHAGLHLPPQPSRVARWRREMTERDRRKFESRAGTMLAELGYAVG